MNARMYTLGSETASNPIEITAVNPSSSFFLGGEKITLTGNGFRQGISVFIDEKECTGLTIVSAQSLSCTLPKFDSVASLSGNSILKKNTTGKLNVWIKSDDGSTSTLHESFQYKSDAFTTVELFTGMLSSVGRSNGVANKARFYRPTASVIHNGFMYVSDTGNQLIRRIDLSTMQSEDFAGTYYKKGSTDGVGTNASFSDPMGMVVVGNDLFVAENTNCVVRKIDLATKQVSLFAGQPGNCSLASDSAVGLNASFGYLSGITTDGSSLYVGDDSYNVRKISLSGSHAVTKANATLDNFIVVIDLVYLNNALYVTEYVTVSDFNLWKIDLSDGTESLLLSTTNRLSGITTDGTYLYISLSASRRLAKLDPASPSLVTIAGNSVFGNTDGVGTAATMAAPAGLFYSNSDIYFTSYGSHNIRKLNINTLEVTTIMGNTK